MKSRNLNPKKSRKYFIYFWYHINLETEKFLESQQSDFSRWQVCGSDWTKLSWNPKNQFVSHSISYESTLKVVALITQIINTIKRIEYSETPKKERKNCLSPYNLSTLRGGRCFSLRRDPKEYKSNPVRRNWLIKVITTVLSLKNSFRWHVNGLDLPSGEEVKKHAIFFSTTSHIFYICSNISLAEKNLGKMLLGGVNGVFGRKVVIELKK